MNLRRRAVLFPALLFALVCAAGCEKTARNMYDQPRDKPLAASSLWADGRSAREPADGTVAHSAGTLAGTSSGREGAAPPEARPPQPLAAGLPPPAAAAAGATAGATAAAAPSHDAWTPALLARGRQRYDIFCAPCHSVVGDGDGMIARRGFPHPPSFHDARLRDAPDEHFYAVITDGYGAMYPYANRVPPDDRHAIVAYIRALQLSQHASLDAVPPSARATLEAAR